jgi:hypothetical protein
MPDQVMMPMFQGMTPGLNERKQIDNIAYKLPISVKTASYTVKLEESGTCFMTTGAAGAVTFTLPKATEANGAIYFFVVGADNNMIVTCPSGEMDVMVLFNDITADSAAYSTTSKKAGNGLTLISDGTGWLCFEQYYLQAAGVLTIAT